MQPLRPPTAFYQPAILGKDVLVPVTNTTAHQRTRPNVSIPFDYVAKGGLWDQMSR